MHLNHPLNGGTFPAKCAKDLIPCVWTGTSSLDGKSQTRRRTLKNSKMGQIRNRRPRDQDQTRGTKKYKINNVRKQRTKTQSRTLTTKNETVQETSARSEASKNLGHSTPNGATLQNQPESLSDSASPFNNRLRSYLVVGKGRVARHMSRYFDLESLPFTRWSRQETMDAFHAKARSASHILLLISDAAIEPFHLEHLNTPFYQDKTIVHFSGSLVSSHIPGAHPLMTFPDELYPLETYRKIPFILEGADHGPWPTLADLLPGLGNPVGWLPPEKKTLYHALCVLSGNFSVLLWEKMFNAFENELGLTRDLAHPYLKQIADNLVSARPEQSVLTGPLVRDDKATIDKHLETLANDPFAGVYRAFVEGFQKSRSPGFSQSPSPEPAPEKKGIAP